MPRIQGRINKLYDNRFKDGQKVTYPYYKMFIGNDELRIYTDQNIDFKEGDEVGLTYAVSKKNNWYVTKNPNGGFSINKIENSMPDDDLPKSEKEWLSAPADAPHDFTPMQYEKDGILDKKGLTIFVQGMLQAGIKSDQIKVSDKEGLELVTTDLIDLYKRITK